jgi:Ino eighty subunit 1
MRAQLRTYHAIPSLQAHQDPNSYKQLQDAPRLKSILKGASEDRAEPTNLDRIKAKAVPRTNPVNLIFVLAQFAPKVTELHFPPGHDFYDLIMQTNISSETRARAFLWLMWFYLESDFTEEGADENPFGAGVDYDVDVRNQGVPRFVLLTPEQEELENIDTQEEKDYGQAKMRERKRIIEADQAAFQAEQGPPKRGPKPKLHLLAEDGGPYPGGYMGRIKPKFEDFAGSPAAILGRMRPKYESDMESTRSTPPPRGGVRTYGLTRGRSSKVQLTEGSSPVAQPGGELMSTMRRPRPLTAHQLAVERNRNQRVDYIIGRGLRKEHHKARKIRKQEGVFYRALKRSKEIENPLEDSESEENYQKHQRGETPRFQSSGMIGLVQLRSETDDYGEQMSAYAAAIRRAGRRLDRWDSEKGLNLGVMGTNRVPQQNLTTSNGNNATRDNDETEDERPASEKDKEDANGDIHMEDDEDLDEMEKQILGMVGSGDDDDLEPDEDLDDVDKELLGLGGDETEEENMEVDSGL